VEDKDASSETNAMEAYLGRALGLVIALNGVVPAEGLTRAHHLIDHGEPAEGLLELAWYITNGGYRVPRSVVEGIREMTADLVPEGYLPNDLDDHIA
jgi:hypothetical protein